MQQILAGMNELNERAQNAEARTTEAATQQEFARKGKGDAVPLQHGQGGLDDFWWCAGRDPRTR